MNPKIFPDVIPIVQVKCSHCGKLNHLYLTPHVNLDCWNCHAKLTFCANCKLPIEPLLDPWGGQHGWYHPTIEREKNVDGVDVMVPATFCPNDLGEAEPVNESTLYLDSHDDGSGLPPHQR